MGYRISVPVWFDGNDHFVDGQLIGVDSDAVVVGIVQKPDGYIAPPYTGPTRPTLFVKDDILGGLYLNMTLQQWQDRIAQVGTIGQGGPNTQTYSIPFAIDTETATITDSNFSGATILDITKGGIGLDPSTYALAGTTITFTSNLEDGDNILVLYKIVS